MKLVRAKLIAAREELIIRERELAAAQRNFNRVLATLKDLEVRLESHLAGLERSSEDVAAQADQTTNRLNNDG